ncbi:MAG: hypothetical protein FWF32_07435 [Endomicrobia bacterium]|nr:hypothetical protein [Endomicrobiia bacterium]
MNDNEYKSIKEISLEIGVVRQTIHKYINTEPLKSELQPYIKYLGNRILIHTDGIELIKSFSINEKDDKDKKDNIEDKKDDKDNFQSNIKDEKDNMDKKDEDKKDKKDKKDNNYTERYIEFLEEQIKIKDIQISELNKSIYNLSQSVNVDKHNELAETIKQPALIEPAANERQVNIKKRPSWQFWKK